MLLDRPKRTTVQFLRRVLTIVLLGSFVLQLGPACGLASAVTSDSMSCCQTKCPAHSSHQPGSCCQLSATSDKATTRASVAPPAHFSSMGLAAIVQQLTIVRAVALIAYRSPTPPPKNTLAILCSRQI